MALRINSCAAETRTDESMKLMFKHAKIAKSSIAAAALSVAMASSAFAVTVSDEQVMTTNGQDFTFEFTGLPQSNGAGGTLTISSGISESNPGVWDGFDIDGQSNSNEFFEVLFEGTSLGTYNCAGNRGHTLIAGCTGSGVDQIFSLSLALSPSMITSALTDGSVAIAVNFSRRVNHLGDRDVLRSALTFEAIHVTPIPMSAVLLATGLVGLAALRRSRRES